MAVQSKKSATHNKNWNGKAENIMGKHIFDVMF